MYSCRRRVLAALFHRPAEQRRPAGSSGSAEVPDGSILNVAISGVAQCAIIGNGRRRADHPDRHHRPQESRIRTRGSVEEADARASALAAAERFSRAVVDSLLCRLCVIDGQGEVVASNKGLAGFRARPRGVDRLLDEMHRLPSPSRGPYRAPASTSEAVEKAIAEMQAGRRMNYTLESIVGKTAMCIGICCRSALSCEGPVRLVPPTMASPSAKLTQQRLEETAERLKQLTLHLDSVRARERTR